MHLCDQSGEAARSAGPCGSHILTCRPGWEWTVTHALPTALTRSARTLPSEELFPPDLRRIREDSHAQVGLKTACQTELPVAVGGVFDRQSLSISSDPHMPFASRAYELGFHVMEDANLGTIKPSQDTDLAPIASGSSDAAARAAARSVTGVVGMLGGKEREFRNSGGTSPRRH